MIKTSEFARLISDKKAKATVSTAGAKTTAASKIKVQAYQVPKSGLWYFAAYIGDRLGVDFPSVAPMIGQSLLESFKPQLVREVETVLKNQRYTRSLREIGDAFVEEDLVKAHRVAIKYGITFQQAAVLGEILEFIKAAR